MYRRPKFLELLLEIRREMAEEAGHDIDQFVQNIHCGPSHENSAANTNKNYRLNGSELKKAAAAKRP
jgi:hypothetical protein